MKNIYFHLLAMLITTFSLAQAPQKMSYQAVIRNSNGELVTDQEVGVRISILQNSIDGAVVYQEIYNPHPKTNNNGLLTIEIGAGVPLTGIFSEIDWSDGPYFIKTETDPAGGTNYTITGTSQLLSVPYALHAKTAETISEPIVESDPVFEAHPASDIEAADIIIWDEAHSWGNHAEEGYLIEEEDPVFNAWDKSTGIAITESQVTDLQDYLTSITGESIGELADVDITGIAVGKILKYDNTMEKWLIAEEEDPIFEVWDKSEGIVITESQISDLQEYLTEETDPSVPIGTQAGEMQYWNGIAWVTLAPGGDGQVLTFSNGMPAWSTTVGWNDVYNPSTGKIWMDRNLGASQVATSSTDAAAYGDLYQWGRASDGHQVRTSSTTTTLSGSDTPGHGDFIVATDDTWDWRSPQNHNLWQGVKGTNNPCPPGYRLPTEAEWEEELKSWISNDAAGAFNSPLKLPLAGQRDTAGSLSGDGSNGCYWSSSGYFFKGWNLSEHLNFNGTGAWMDYGGRALGASVRCIKD